MNQRDEDVERQAQEFAHRLKVTRDRQRLSQNELAERSGLTPAAISQLEGGQRTPNFSTIVRLAGALKTSPNNLIGLDDEGEIDPSLRPLFRDVKQLSRGDVETVKAYVAFLRQQKKE